MNTELTLNVYTHIPDIFKLTKDGYSQFDYITFLFEASFVNINGQMPKKIQQSNFVFTTSLFVDYYVEDNDNEHLNISFDIMETNDEGIALECYLEKKKYTEKTFVPKKKKKALVEKKYDVDCLKKYSIQLTNQYCNLSEALQEFYNKQIKPQYLGIESYLIKNNISYNKNKLEEFISESLIAAQKCFTKEYLSSFSDEFLMEKINEIDVQLSAKNLEIELPVNSSITKRNKI